MGVPLPGQDPYVAELGLERGSSAQWMLQIGSMSIAGFGFTAAWTPCLPTLIETASDKVALETGASHAVATQRVSAPVAAVFNAAAAIGEASGPLLGGIFVRTYG